MSTEIILIIIGFIISILLLIILLIRKNSSDNIRNELGLQLKQTREELTNILSSKITDSAALQQKLLTDMIEVNIKQLENNRKNIEENLQNLQKDNNDKLEKMRVTVDEKLQGTLEKRLGESFKLVNDRLESVYKGLGEMQNLAQGVGDLKKVFSNVKSRGYWGEIQLGNILEQFLTTDQYETNVKTKEKSNEFVEYAIKLPGKESGEYVWLPIDSKFPIESYEALVTSEENADVENISNHRKELERAIRLSAKDIYEKYIDVPNTTDFGIMFLPIESLYSEVLRNTSLCEEISRKYRVLVSGPTTFMALLNSLQMGFRTLAIEKRSSEVWKILRRSKNRIRKVWRYFR